MENSNDTYGLVLLEPQHNPPIRAVTLPLTEHQLELSLFNEAGVSASLSRTLVWFLVPLINDDL